MVFYRKYHFGITITLQDGVYDADIHIELLDSAIAEGGRNCIVLCDASLPPVKMGNVPKIFY